MSEETHKPKKNSETVQVEKDFILKITKQLGEHERRIGNLEAIKETDDEVAKIPVVAPMTRIISSPTIDIEVNFLNKYTMNQMKEEGLKFQIDLEALVEKYKILSISLKFHREIS